MNTTQGTITPTHALTPEELDMIEQADVMLRNQEALPAHTRYAEDIEDGYGIEPDYKPYPKWVLPTLEIIVFFTGCAAAWLIVTVLRVAFGW
jgi:hypothetical protein